MDAPRKTRSRGACETCRKRKRKCDETRPACLVCQKRKIPCGGYPLKLTWNCGVASRGRLAGSGVPVRDNKSKITTDSTGAPDRKIAQTVEHRRGSYNDESLPQASWSPDPVAWFSQDSPTPDWESVLLTKEEEASLFSHFLDSKIHLLYATSTDDKMIGHFREAGKESSALVIVCVALALFNDPDMVEKFHLSFEKALRIFKQELEACEGVLKRGTVCAGLLLCTLSILQGLHWTNHLHCMVDLYNLHGDLLSLPPVTDPFTEHCLEVIGVMDLPCFVFGRRTAPLTFWRRLRRAQLRWRGSVRGGVEMMSGLPRSLLDILARLDEPSVELELWNWCSEVGEYLQAQLWDAWRYAAILVVRGMKGQESHIDRVEGDATDMGGEYQCPASAEYLLWRLISSLNTLMLGLQQPEAKTFLFGNGAFCPYLVARCEFGLLREHPVWQAKLNHLLTNFINTDTMAYVTTADSIIQKAWDRGDQICNLHEIALDHEVELGAF